MSDKKPGRVNPFYVILVVAGIAFALTACAYGVMAVKQLHAAQDPFGMQAAEGAAPGQSAADAQFIRFMDSHGVRIMLVELSILGLATFAAIGTDHWFQDPADAQVRSNSELTTDHKDR